MAGWGSHYPNQDASSATDAIEDLERGGVSGQFIAQLMGGNAMKVFGLSGRTGK